MKTLVKTYYTEPRVDSRRIMKNIFVAKEHTLSSYEILLVPISAICLLLVFLYFLVSLNVTFLSTVVSGYFALGWILFCIFNIVIGIFVFISEHYETLILFSWIIGILQIWLSLETRKHWNA